MEKLGENYLSNFLTFRYAGREPRSVSSFLNSRPDVKNYYIYDLCLSTGTLLYSCAGGIGITKERYIVDMHTSIRVNTFSNAIKDYMESRFKSRVTKHSYLRLREKYNEKPNKLAGVSDCAELYLLWMCSNFSHKYRSGGGYDGNYLPCTPDLDLVKNASNISREKNLLFRKEDLFSFSESIINDNLVIYFHIPDSYGLYGAGFLWNKNRLYETISIVRELCQFGYKICVSALHAKRGQLCTNYQKLFPELRNVYIEQFKVSKLGSGSINSDIYLLNF